MTYDFTFRTADGGYEATTPYDFWFYLFIDFNLLPEVPINLISIDIDEGATMDTGFIYITMKNSFLIVNMETKTIYDMYTYTSAGRSGETLDYETIEKSDVN